MKAPIVFKQFFDSLCALLANSSKGTDAKDMTHINCTEINKAQEELGRMRARLTYSRLESLSAKYGELPE